MLVTRDAHGLYAQFGWKPLGSPERWMERVERDGHGYVETRSIDDRDGAREHLLMNMRLREGLDVDSYERRWHTALNRARIAELASDGLVSFDGAMLAATGRGRLVLNAIITQLAA
jgi:oxygen-independent coproporphyrinogen-3 oxidase